MLGININHIELSGVKLPIRCDMLVLEKIQEDYGDISEFENKLIGFEPIYNEDGSAKVNENGKSVGKSTLPDIKTVHYGLWEFVKEGIDCSEQEIKYSEKDLIRMVDISIGELSDLLHEEFMRCFKRKNQNPTQKETKEKTP